jgi:alkylation response protein AidB-like acyl-CoA dehydrogenase
MDFALTEQQHQLRAVARAWLAENAPADTDRSGERERQILLNGQDGDHWWREVAALGWLDPDLGVVDLAVLAEETARALHPSGWLATISLAAPAYLAAGRWPGRPATLAWAEPDGSSALRDPYGPIACRAIGRERTVRLFGRKTWVVGPADEVVVLASDGTGAGLFHVDVSLVPEVVRDAPTIDLGRRSLELHLVGTPAERLVTDADAPGVLRRTRHRTLTLLAAEAVGVAQRALDHAVDHARSRVQFGRPIGSFQAVAHQLADAAGTVELARTLAYRAAWCVQANRDDAAEAAVAATVAAREAALQSCRAAIQTHGGQGFVWQQPLNRLYRRARWIAAFDGSTSGYRRELARMVAQRTAAPNGSPVAASAGS